RVFEVISVSIMSRNTTQNVRSVKEKRGWSFPAVFCSMMAEVNGRPLEKKRFVLRRLCAGEVSLREKRSPISGTKE
ncbi:MAG TPA: hypothetical protein PK393_09920, partial [Synergistaceae bacterium]|nr:hypothetical protein [Synergistaceae bacterium]